MSFSFANVEAALALSHDIAPSKRSAFANRLKHLQKLGFLPEIRTGRGKAADYKGHHIFLLGLALQFIEMGLTPERTIFAIEQEMDLFVIPTRLAIATLAKEKDPHPFFVRFDPSSLDSLRYDNAVHAPTTAFYSGSGSLAESIKGMATRAPRLALINITSLVSDTFSSLHEIDPKLAERYELELQAWLESHLEHGESET